MLTSEQKKQIKERFQELRQKLDALVDARNDFEKIELGKKRDWKKIAEIIANPELDKTGRMNPLQYPDCFICEVMEKKCFIWDSNPEHRDCPELLFLGFCYAEPCNDPNDFKHAGLFKRAVMYKRCLHRLALRINEKGTEAESVEPTRYCKHYCPKYQKCMKQKTLYDQYLLCEITLEEALKESIGYVDEIIRACSR